MAQKLQITYVGVRYLILNVILNFYDPKQNGGQKSYFIYDATMVRKIKRKKIDFSNVGSLLEIKDFLVLLRIS